MRTIITDIGIGQGLCVYTLKLRALVAPGASGYYLNYIITQVVYTNVE